MERPSGGGGGGEAVARVWRTSEERASGCLAAPHRAKGAVGGTGYPKAIPTLSVDWSGGGCISAPGTEATCGFSSAMATTSGSIRITL